MVSWMRQGHSIALSAAFGRSRHAVVLVVVLAPILHLFSGVCKVQEPVRVQTLRPETTIECCDIGTLIRL
jgi:hypothetical protein